MSQTTSALVILVLLLPLWLRLRRDFIGGLAYAVFLQVTCSTLLRIEMPGALPQLTIHRLVVISLFLAWLLHPGRTPIREVPLARWLFLWASLGFISLLGSIDPVQSVKRYLDFILELFLFYFIVATTLKDPEDALRVLRGALVGLTVVALLAALEKYTGINVVDRFISADPEGGLARDVRVTYRHRILLGAGMAMGWPLALAMRQLAPGAFRRFLWLGMVAAMLAACYYAMSRGPWLAAILAGGLLVAFGTRVVRRQMVFLGILAVMVLATRPGVVGTLSRYVTATADKESFKGGTFQYRLELWAVAFDAITTSPGRFLFGFGPGAAANQSIEWTLSYRGRNFNIESWDNDFAYSLYQYGVLGLLTTLVLYGSIAWRLFQEARSRVGPERDLYLCLCASALVLFFMMSNVHIFARQLYYLLWIVAASGLVGLRAQTADAPALETKPGAEPLHGGAPDTVPARG